MENIEITSLVKQAAQGDSAAFGRLYELTGRKIYFTALKLTGSDADAQDILQDSFMTAFQKLPELTSSEYFEPWLMRIAVNRCKMQFRSQKTTAEEPEIMESIEDTDLIPEDYVMDRAKRKVIMDIIDRVLTEDQRRTVILFYYSQLSVEEISSVMDCPKGTVLSRLHLARGKIREAVLIYENKSGDRLHMLMPILVLTRLLDEEAKELALSQLAMTGTVGTAAAAVAKSGGKTMVKAVKAKVIAGIAAGVVAAVGIGAAVMLLSGDDKDSKNKKPAKAERPESSMASAESPIMDESSSADNVDDSRGDTSSVADSSADENDDQNTQLDEIQQLIDKFLTGVKNGDADAILETVYDPERYAAIAPDAKSREFAMEATKYIFQELEWDFGAEANLKINSDVMKTLEKYKKAMFYVSYSAKSFMAAESKYIATLNIGDRVEFLGYNSTKEDFYRYADAVRGITPNTMQLYMEIKLDNSGAIKIDADNFLYSAAMADDYDLWGMDRNSEQSYYGELSDSFFSSSTLKGKVVREGFIGNRNSPYSCNDELNELISMLREKDYGKAYEYLMSSDNELIREYIKKNNGSPLKKYSALDDEQKAKVLEYIKNETETIYSDYIPDNTRSRYVTIVLYFKDLSNTNDDSANYINTHEVYYYPVWTLINNRSEADKLFGMLEPLDRVASYLLSAKVI